MSVLVGRKAPDFTAPVVLADGTIVDNYTLSERTRGQYVVVIFYPHDFTFVCPSELIAFDRRSAEFGRRDVQLVAVSTDSHHTHYAWRNTPIDSGGIGAVGYPLVADMTHAIAKAYGVETLDGTAALRGSFLIDRSGVVRHQIVNDLPLGRDVDEMLRVVDALQYHDQFGEVCPAGWHRGKRAMKATYESVAAYLTQEAATL